MVVLGGVVVAGGQGHDAGRALALAVAAARACARRVRSHLGGCGTRRGPLRAAAACVLRPRDDAPVRREGCGARRVVVVADVELR